MLNQSAIVVAMAWSLALLRGCVQDSVESAMPASGDDAAMTPEDGSPDGGPMDDIAACTAGYECVIGCPDQECETACFFAVSAPVSAVLAEALTCTGNAGCNVGPTINFDCLGECRGLVQACLGPIPSSAGDDDCAALYACSLGCDGFEYACLRRCLERASAGAATAFDALQSCAAGEAQCDLDFDFCLSERCPTFLMACPYPR